jgi:HAD superfamily hydrolase (TIGR01509 family)
MNNKTFHSKTTSQKKPAVIFDLDGVLINSVPTHYRSLKKLFKEIGIDYTMKEMLDKDITIGSMNLIPRVLKDRGIKYDVKVLLDRKTQLIKNKYIPLNSGVLNLLKKLKNNGFTIALASNGTTDFVYGMIRKLKLKEYFSHVLTGDDIKKHKPNPEIYLKMAKLLKARPKDCVVIEDSKFGVLAAKRAGMKVIGHKMKIEKQDLRKADIIVNSMKKVTVEMIES